MQHRILPLTPLFVWGILGACADTASAPGPSSVPVMPTTTVAHMRGTGDFVNGTLTFESIAPASSGYSGAPDFSAGIYGAQGTTVRIYNSAVVVTNPSSPGKKTFSANVGVRNLLAFKVGDEQSGAAPDTMGIFVFVSSGPTVRTTSSSCPSCTVTVKNGHGQLTFTAPLQRYWYWPDRLDAVNGTRDTTLVRKAWVFEADTQVTTFGFDVLVSAAWSAPNETRWKVDYEGDSLPESQSEPKWTLQSVVGTHTAASGVLHLVPGLPTNQLNFFRRDSVRTAMNAYVEASVKYTGIGVLSASPHFGVDDAVKNVALGMNATTVGFVSVNNTFIGTTFAMNTTSGFHVYQLRKYAADSAVFFVDGTRHGVLSYATFSASASGASAPVVAFGHTSAGLTESSDWDYVVYEIGSPFP
jgi:hypothetical protein